jgi:hypothetical protein
LFNKISALLPKIEHPYLPSAIKPVTLCEVLPVPTLTESYTADDDDDSETVGNMPKGETMAIYQLCQKSLI